MDRRPQPEFVRRSCSRSRNGETNTTTIVIIILAIVGGILLLACAIGAAFLLPAIQAARGGARQVQSENNLRMIGLALHNYHDTYMVFPPGGIYGEDGTEYHSWQTMLLPYIDQSPLHQQIDFHQPWDEPPNSFLMSTPVHTYLHPSVAEQFDPQGFALSHYAGNSQLFLPNSSMRFADIIDGSSNTMMAGEVAAGFKPWGDPSNVRDPAAGIAVGPDMFSGPAVQNGTTILMTDGSTRTVPDDIDPAVLSALATPGAGDDVGEF